MTPYYEDEAVTIYHGDARDGLPEADILVTDPPYGIRYVSERFGGVANDLDFEVTASVIGSWWGSAMVVFASHASLGRTMAYLGRYSQLRVGVWHKSNVNGSAHGGMWWSDVEFFVSAFDKMPRIPRSAVASAPKNTGNPNWQRGNSEAYLHPTQKPVSVMLHILQSFPDTGTVLDPFMGSGSTLVAAKSLGRKAIGIEIEEKYCERAANRCRQEVLGLSFLPMSAVGSAVPPKDESAA